ncbi:MAG: ATP-binding cassette domain-containing protein [Mariprofundaceae bacterium]
MIRAEGLTRYYGDMAAVCDLSFEVRQGEVMGLLGPNGAGKSTTMKMLTCFLPPSSGSASVEGVPLDDAIEVRRRIGYLPENAPSWRDLDVRSHLRFIGRMHGLPAGTLADRIAEMARLCGLEGVLHRRIDELSKGYRQRVGLAASMLHDPPCLILDEPTTGLDPNQILEIRRLIRRLGERKTVLLSSHVLAEIEAVCDRIMIIDAGELKAIGTPAEVATAAGGGRMVRLRLQGDAGALAEALRERLPDAAMQADESEAGAWLVRGDAAADGLAAAVFQAAVDAGVVLTELHEQRLGLEEVFRRITTPEDAS